MTNEEAREILDLNNKKRLDYPLYAEAEAIAVEAFIKAEKYRWHDLRKNPDDLPDNIESVLICIKGFEGRTLGVNVVMHSSFTKLWGTESCSYKECEVIAWREIEPFEEE